MDPGSSLKRNAIGMRGGYFDLNLKKARVVWEERISISKIALLD